ncbi:MAG: hypothetical protein OEU92_17980 [Alphaproteobacteria bacterium]|nr:hypothetical protein [Alphaproteobacteria bacterium]
MLYAAGPSSPHAEDRIITAQSLEEAVKAGNAQPVRFVLSSGKTVIGRIVKIGDDALIIRRPSAGLVSLALADIVSVNIKTKDGGLMHGQITRMTDGAIGWLADDAAKSGAKTEIAEVAPETLSETGGPLIPLGNVDFQRDDGPAEAIEDADAAVQPIAVKPAEVVTPKLVTPIEADPIRLMVTADQAKESDKLIYFRLTLSEPAPRSILIIYTMIDGTATAPGDYTHRQGVVVFEPGQTQAVVATSIVNDETSEDAESFSFFVTGDPSAVIIEERKIAATIEDDDNG